MHETGSDLLAPIALARCVRQLPKYATTTTTATSVLVRIVPSPYDSSVTPVLGGHILQHCAICVYVSFVRVTSKSGYPILTHTHIRTHRSIVRRVLSSAGACRILHRSFVIPSNAALFHFRSIPWPDERTLGCVPVTLVIEIVWCHQTDSVERAKATTKHTQTTFYIAYLLWRFISSTAGGTSDEQIKYQKRSEPPPETQQILENTRTHTRCFSVLAVFQCLKIKLRTNEFNRQGKARTKNA